MQGVILLLFAKYYHLPFLRDVQTDCTRTGLGGYWVSMGAARALVLSAWPGPSPGLERLHHHNKTRWRPAALTRVPS